jgi:hypothetical protein
MTGGKSASLSRCQAPIWGSKPDFCYCQTVAGWLIYSAFSDKRAGLSFTIAGGLASTVILVYKSCGTHNQSLLPQIQYSSNLTGQVPYLYHPGTVWPSYNPRHWVPFSLPPMTCSATVEVFEFASMWDNPGWQQLESKPKSNSKLCYDRGQSASLSWCQATSGAQDQIFVIVRQLCVCSLTATQSQTQSYVTTDGQSPSLSWCQATTWGPRPDFLNMPVCGAIT